MCKFTNRLFVFALLALVAADNVSVVVAKPGHVRGSPLAWRRGGFGTNAVGGGGGAAAGDSDLDGIAGLLEQLYADYNDYDREEISYDQRQKGGDNVRLHLDSFFAGVPLKSSMPWNLLFDILFLDSADDLHDYTHKDKLSIYQDDLLGEPKVLATEHPPLIEHQSDQQQKQQHIVKIPAPKKEAIERSAINARENLNNINGSRAKSHLLRLWNMIQQEQQQKP